MLISFEGIDGCGKSTQLIMLQEYLQSKGYDVVAIREPGGTALSEQIRNILLDRNNEIYPMTELLLFEAARATLVDSVILPALAEGKIILSDRFYDSTVAYQGFGRNLDIEQIKILNKIATRSIVPDITFYLKVPLDIAIERNNKLEKDRIEALGKHFFEKVMAGFNQLANDEPNRIIVIDASDSKINTHNCIIQKINID